MKSTDLSELKANAVTMAGRLKLMSHPERLLMLFSGANFGKLVLRVA